MPYRWRRGQFSSSTMSFVITDTSPVFVNPVAVAAPAAGTNTNAVNAVAAPVQLGGGTTTGTSTGTPGSVTATNTVSYTTAAATAGQVQQVVVSGAGTKVNVNTGAAKVQAIGGGTIVEAVQSQTDTAPKTISLGDTSAPFNGVAVSTTAQVSTVVIDPTSGAAKTETVTVAQVSGGQGGPFAYYAHGGFGNDSIEGSSLADFIRGGSGNDTINGFGGNDLIRGGVGSDSIFGGSGADTLYYTADQFPAISTTDRDVFVDFTSGTDKISIDRTVAADISKVTFSSDSKTISFSGPTGRGNVQVTSGNTAIQASDINFI